MYGQVNSVKNPQISSVDTRASPPRDFKGSQFWKRHGCCTGGFQYFKLYMETCCNHCYVYLVKNGLTLLERLFWLILIVVSHYFCIDIALKSVSRFLTNNSYMGIERNYFDWNTTLPSLTICPMQRLDELEFEKYIKPHDLTEQQRDEFWDYLEHLANSTYLNFQDIPTHNSLDITIDKLQLTPDKYMEVIFNLTVDHTLNPVVNNRVRCIDNDEYIHSRQVLTEWGLCYMTNNLIDDRYTSKYMLFGTLPEENMYEASHRVKQIQQGSFPDKYIDYNFIGFQSPIDVYTHSPYEVMKVDNNYGYTTENLYYEPEVAEITTQPNFESIATIQQRNCRFSHESNLTHFPVYTKNLCQQECRLKLVFDECKCIPHFYPNRLRKPKRVCDYRILRQCLPKHESYFLKLYRERPKSGKLDIAHCPCDQNCMGSVIGLKVSLYTRSKELYGSYGATMNVREWPTVRYKREIYLTFTDLLVYIGGTAGLFLGFSVLGLIEMFYFLTMRLIFHLIGYKL